jgi:hypothetical protein
MSDQNSTPAGWYTDPSDPQRVRYWDGGNWSSPSYSVSPSAATAGVLGASASTQAPTPWWQTWFAIVPALLLCLPLGLVGLWLRPGTSRVAKTAVTAGTVLLLSIGFLTPDDPASTTSAIPAATPSPLQPRATLHLHPNLHLLHPRLQRWLGFRALRGLIWAKQSASYAPPTSRSERSIADHPAKGRTLF